MQSLKERNTSSSSSSLDKPAKDMQMELVCQNPKCKKKSVAVKVCHHSDCRESNNNRPFLLCHECSIEIHKVRSRSGHLCFDIPKKRGNLLQNMWTVDKRTQGNSQCGRQPLYNEDSNIENCQREDDVSARHKNTATDHHSVRCSNLISRHHLHQHKIEEDECQEKTGRRSNGVSSGRSYDQKCDRVRQERNDVVSIGNRLPVNGEHECSDEPCCQGADVEEEKSTKDSCDEPANESVQHQRVCHQHSVSEPLCDSSELFRNILNDQERFDHGENDLKDQNEIENDDDDDNDDLEEDQRRSGGDQDIDAGSRDGLVINGHHRSDWSCVEGPFMANGTTTNGADFEFESQDDDMELSESESSSLNLRLRRKKAVKIKKRKPNEGVVRRCPSVSGIDIQRWKSSGRQEKEPECRGSEADQTTLQCIVEGIVGGPEVSSQDVGTENQTESRSTTPSTSSRTENDYQDKSGILTDRQRNSESEKDSPSVASKNSKPNDPSETRRNYRRNLPPQDDSHRNHFLGRTAKLYDESLRKFSLTNEYLTLRFDAEEILIATPRGLPLGRAISSLIADKWGLTLSQCDVFLDSSNSPLPLSSDCYLLASNTLCVKVKPNKRRKRSGNQVLPSSNLTPLPPSSREKNKQNGNIKTLKKLGSPDEYISVEGGLGGCSSLSQNELQKIRSNAKAASKIQSFFQFSKLPDKQEHLTYLLNGYSNNGLPKMPDLLTLGRPQFDPTIFHLERHWKDIVAGHELLTKPQRDQQEAIWELLTTEVEYIRKLRVVNNLFMCCLFNLQNEQVLNEIEADKLFSNISDVYYATCHFWKAHLSQVLQEARTKKELLNPSLLKSGFIAFRQIFKPYTKYCLEQDMCQDYIRTKTKENDLFRNYVEWGQSLEQCRLLRLQDILCGPWQRLMRYRLLLKEILKYTELIEKPTPDDQVNDLENMLEQVEKFVAEVNNALCIREESRQMAKLMNRIESYEVVESLSDECIKLLNRFSRFDLMTPVAGCGSQEMRMLILEGSLKLKDAFSKVDVYCFLFTDLFLVTKLVSKKGGDKLKVVKPPMRLDKLVIQSLRDASCFVLLYLNEYHVAQALYTFHGDSRQWTESLKKAQTEYKEKRFQYFIRPDNNNLSADDDENMDEDEAFTNESPSATELNQTTGKMANETPLPKVGSELSIASASDRTKHGSCESQFNSSTLSWPSKSKSPVDSSLSFANSRLNSSCDQLALSGNEDWRSAARKLRPSPSFSKSSTIDCASGRTAKDRSHSEGISKACDRDLRGSQETPRWNCDSDSIVMKDASRVHRSKSPNTLPNPQRKPGSDYEVPVADDTCERLNCVTFDGQDFRQIALTQNDSATTTNDFLRSRKAASVPFFAKLSPTGFAICDDDEVPDEKQGQSRAVILGDCTLESTDV